ncbi:MAG: VTT domain-containing protein [Chloroflexi bacterium]|nr:VTT domain-containing protein [Chloroflexota bacterium]
MKREETAATTREIVVGALALAFSIALIVIALLFRDYLTGIANIGGLGLLSVFLISFIAGSTVSITMIPVPYWLVVFVLSDTLSAEWGLFAPIFVGTTAASGATLGQLPSFLIGYGGGGVSERLISRLSERLYQKASEMAQRYGSLAVFLASAIINPLHLPMTLAMGALRFHPGKWLLLTFLGNLVKSLAIAFAGYFALHFISDLLEKA